MKKRHTLETQIAALRILDEHGGDFLAAAEAAGISPGVLRKWHKQQHELEREYQRQQQTQAALLMAQVQRQVAEKSLQIVNALDEDRIAKAPLNQLATALGILIDRYLKLTDDLPQDTEQVIRFEFRHPDGSFRATPPWAAEDYGHASAVQGGGVRAAVRQDDAGKNYTNGKGAASRAANVVARTDLSDGESGLAGFEDDDTEHLWYEG